MTDAMAGSAGEIELALFISILAIRRGAERVETFSYESPAVMVESPR